ncbi:MAG: phosphate-starvation-inducible PsiE family protein [Synechococcaceae cyanobacterium]|nr:phosphate-starvation-inducible PsiE family protein [Synechococcaceae cyanobacterium]
MSRWHRALRACRADSSFLRFIDSGEHLLAKLLGLLLLLITFLATFQLIGGVVESLFTPNVDWMGVRLMKLLGDLLNLLIALEVLKNITAYMRRGVVQIELVLITAITAVARKVIVLPQGAEGKPALLLGLGAAVLALAVAYWLVRQVRPQRGGQSRTGQARGFLEPDRSPPADAGGGL